MKQDMTQGNPWKILTVFALPVLAGLLFQQMYNMVDTIIVGRYLGETALAAVGSTGCLMFLVLGFAMGISQGFGVLIAQTFGAKDYRMLRHYVALSLILTAIVSVILTIPTVALSRWVLVWMNCPDNVLDQANAYIRIIFLGIFAAMLYNVGSCIMRGVGDSRTPLYLLVFSSILNIVLDVFCIVTLHMGTGGAALATVIAQGIAGVLCFILMFTKSDILRIGKADCYLDRDGVAKMLLMGLPMALNYSVTAVGTVIMQSAINIYGSSVMAAYTAACKVTNIATQTCPTIGTTMSTYCGQNLGAGKYRRIKEGMNIGFLFCIFAEVVALILTIPLGRPFLGLFLAQPSEEVLRPAMQYLYACAWFYIPLAWIFMYRNCMQALGSAFVPMLSGIVELFGRFSVIWVAQRTIGYTGVILADGITWLITGVAVLICYKRWEYRHVTCRQQLSLDNEALE